MLTDDQLLNLWEDFEVGEFDSLSSEEKERLFFVLNENYRYELEKLDELKKKYNIEEEIFSQEIEKINV